MNAAARTLLVLCALALATPALAHTTDNGPNDRQQHQHPAARDYPWDVLGIVGALGLFGLGNRGVYRRGAPRG